MRATSMWLAWSTSLVISGLSSQACALEATTTVVYVVRHAEKEVGPSAPDDPALTEVGKARAARLAVLLEDVPLVGVYSTDTLRTRDTGEPAAKGHKLEVSLYDYADPVGLKAKLTLAGGSYLVVGHSNTVPGIVEAFGGAVGEPIGDEDYDRLYVLTVPAGQPLLTSTLLHY